MMQLELEGTRHPTSLPRLLACISSSRMHSSSFRLSPSVFGLGTGIASGLATLNFHAIGRSGSPGSMTLLKDTAVRTKDVNTPEARGDACDNPEIPPRPSTANPTRSAPPNVRVCPPSISSAAYPLRRRPQLTQRTSPQPVPSVQSLERLLLQTGRFAAWCRPT